MTETMPQAQTTLAVLEDAGYWTIRAASRATGHAVSFLRKAISDGRLPVYSTDADRRVQLLRAEDVLSLRTVVPVEREEAA